MVDMTNFDEIKKTQENEFINDNVKAKAVVDIISNPQKALDTKISEKLSNEIDTKFATDEGVQKKLSNTVDKVVDSSLNTVENKVNTAEVVSQDEKNEADFNKNKADYLNFGVNNKVDKKWKKQMIEIENDIWFFIIGVLSFFTLVPVHILIDRFTVTTSKIAKASLGLGLITLMLGFGFCIIGLPILHSKGIV